MATLVTRSGKGSPLTHAEVDANFTNLNTDKLELSGGTMTGNLSFGDNDKAVFGAGSDLQIYHDGSNSYIDDAGTGSLRIRAQDLLLADAAGNPFIAMLDLGTGGSVSLRHNTVEKLATTSTGIDVTGNATFADNGKAIFGAGSDLQIYHDGSNSYIDDQGTGRVYIRASDQLRLQASDGENYALFSANGAAQFYYDNSQKLATTSTGIDVTGTVTADGLTVDGDASVAGTVGVIADSGTIQTGKDSSSTRSHLIMNNPTGQVSKWDTNSSNLLHLVSGDYRLYTNGAKAFEVDSNGDISFYEDTGTTAKFFWDASAESLGIGTSSPSYQLDVVSSGAAQARIQSASGSNAVFRIETAGTADETKIYFGDSLDIDRGQIIYAHADDSMRFRTNAVEAMRIDSSGNVGIGTSSPRNASGFVGLTLDDTSGSFVDFNDSGARVLTISGNATGNDINTVTAIPLRFKTNNTERMRIDSSGNLLVGKTSIGLSTTGIDLRSTGLLQAIRNGGTVVELNRQTSDGTIIDFRKDNTTVGSIGNSGGAMYISAASTGGLKFSYLNGTSAVTQPCNTTGATTNGTHDFGTSGARFRDLYLSGGTKYGSSSDFGQVRKTGGELQIDSYGTGGARHPIKFTQYTTEVGRFDASGNLLVGKTAADGATDGGEIRAGGTLVNTTNNSTTAYFNRRTSDGDLISFQKDGTTVGSIGTLTASGVALQIKGEVNAQPADIVVKNSGGSAITYRFHDSLGFYGPDATQNLGRATARWKDLYLSGGVYLGGTGAVNKLEDYEFGTFIPTFIGSTSGTVTLATAFDKYAYTKVGRVVTITGRVDVSGTPSLSGNLLLQGLPFSSGNLLDSAGFTVQYGFITIGSSNTGNPIVVELQENVTQATLRLEDWTSAAGVLTNNSRIQMSITYFTN